MSKVLVIGAGGVSSVCVHKMAFNTGIFSQIHLASRTRSKCDAIAASVKERTGIEVPTYEIEVRDGDVFVNPEANPPGTFVMPVVIDETSAKLEK